MYFIPAMLMMSIWSVDKSRENRRNSAVGWSGIRCFCTRNARTEKKKTSQRRLETQGNFFFYFERLAEIKI